MIEFMDCIVEAVEEFAKSATDVAVFSLIFVTKMALIITAPVWLLPYAMWRKGRKE